MTIIAFVAMNFAVALTVYEPSPKAPGCPLNPDVSQRPIEAGFSVRSTKDKFKPQTRNDFLEIES